MKIKITPEMRVALAHAETLDLTDIMAKERLMAKAEGIEEIKGMMSGFVYATPDVQRGYNYALGHLETHANELRKQAAEL